CDHSQGCKSFDGLRFTRPSALRGPFQAERAEGEEEQPGAARSWDGSRYSRGYSLPFYYRGYRPRQKQMYGRRYPSWQPKIRRFHSGFGSSRRSCPFGEEWWHGTDYVTSWG